MPILISDILPPPYSEYLITYFVPFIILFAIFWGALTMMKVFSKKINTLLAMIFPLVFMFGAPETFLWFSNYLITLGSFLAIGAFVAVFVFGVIAWALQRGRDIYIDVADYDSRILKKRKEMRDVAEKIATTSDDAKKAHYSKRYQDLQNEISILEAEKARLQPF
jgi:hypothetical protein